MFRRVLILLAVLVAEHAYSQPFWRLMPNTPANAGPFYDLLFDRRGDAFLSFAFVGPHLSVNYGGTWVPASSGLPGNDVSKFTSPAVDLHLAGLFRGQFPTAGIFRTTNAGSNWTASGLNSRSVSHVQWYTGQTVFAIADGVTLYRSTNNGATWDSVFAGGGVGGGGFTAFVTNRITATVFAASNVRGVFRSTNNGTTWISANAGLLDSLAVVAMAVDSTGAIFAAVGFQSNSPGRVYRSTNNGASWAILGNIGFGPQELFLNPSGHLFALAVEYGISRSTDGGRSWGTLHTGFSDSGLVYGGTVSPGGYVYVGTVTGVLYRSEQPTAPPIIPTLLAPANGSIQQNQTVQFWWTRYESGAIHHLQIATSPSFTQTSLLVNDSTLGSNITSGITLPRAQLLYWRVRVRNSLGWGNFSQPWTVGVQPAAPALLSPPDSAANQPLNPTLSWENLGASITYHLQVSMNSAFTSLVVNDSTLTATQRTVGPLANSTTYYWRVRAANSPTGPGPFSASRRFTTVGVPQVFLQPSLLSYRAVQLGSRVNATALAINLGTAPLLVDSIRLTGPNASEFTIVGATGPFPPVAPFDTLRIVVQCTPQSVGLKSAFLRIFSNAPSSPDTVRLSADAIPSQVQVNVGQARVGDSLRVSVTVQQGFRPVVSELFFRNGGQQTYRTTTLTPRGDTLLATLPPQVLNIRGVEYYVLLRDSANNVLSFPAGDYINNPALVRVSVQSVLFPQALQGLRYRMISIPLDLAQQDFLSVLGDDFGSYDRVNWRIFRWNRTAYAEFDQIASPFFRPGVAYWLITRSGGSFDVENGQSVISTQPYTILLQPGWNQIATPFAFSVDWQTIGNSQLVRAPFFFDGVQFVPNAFILQPWEGYFVFNDSTSAIPLIILPIEAEVGNRMHSPALSGGSYVLRLSALAGVYSDAYNYLGFRPDATEGDDKLDLPEPPPVSDHLQLSIVENGQTYACNFKPPTVDGQQWELRVTSNVPHETVNVTLYEEGERPHGFRLFVLDEDERAAVPVNDGSFTIRLAQANTPRTLRIIVGTEAYAHGAGRGIPLEPIEYALHQNYPNPFNPSTTIRYALKKRSDVRLEVFNLLGQRVRTLVSADLGAGVYSVAWDGNDQTNTPVASGVYIVQLHAGEFRASKKIMLVR